MALTLCALRETGSGHNYAISSGRLSNQEVSTWTVEVTNPGCLTCLGIIGNPARVAATSYDFKNSILRTGTGNNPISPQAQMYTGGVDSAGTGGWTGWKSDDRATFMYDPRAGTLSLRLARTGITYVINTGALPEAYIHCMFYDNGTVVKFLN